MNNETKKSKTDRLISVSFPRGLLEEVDLIVKKNKTKYVSRADFCRSAVRMLIKEDKGVFPLRERDKDD